MPLKPPVLERQHEQAQARLEEREGVLSESGVDADGMRRDPVWRSLRARCRRIARKLARAREIASAGRSG